MTTPQAFDWPPRLTFEHQQQIVYEHMQGKVRFSGPNGRISNVFDLCPRPVWQRLYRAAVVTRYGEIFR